MAHQSATPPRPLARPAARRPHRAPLPAPAHGAARIARREHLEPVRGPSLLRVVVRACRPRQWAKNALLVAAPLAAGVIGREPVALDVALAAAAFCMVSSATYLLNDVRDRAQDRAHPRKRLRPVASGVLSVPAALTIATMLAGGGLGLAALVRPALAAICGGYIALMAVYSLWLRRLFVADILVIASGFVLRAAAGGVAAHVPLSAWFMLVVSAAAVFVVAGKRHAELLAGTREAFTRPTLRRYTARALRIALVLAATATAVTYALWATQRPEHAALFELSIVPVVAWLLRYGVLLGRGAGEAPEDLILRDRALLALTGGATALFLGGVYGGR